MPTSSPATGDGAPPTSASSSSSIIFGSMSGSHVLKIVCYSHSKQSVVNGRSIKSCRFYVAGRNWHVQYNPNGWKSEDTDCISLYLVLDDNVAEAVKA
ncbi:hypothetical protein SETIT_9G246500v2 [Setaria italica]|uniref:MATH domain-containing protein n=1 Tax=Setaria italica TaxID=4555 RepID=K4ALY2_SETIT|nr:hypothetical protein SETIT_9G246500v2 [Setaria italica]